RRLDSPSPDTACRGRAARRGRRSSRGRTAAWTSICMYRASTGPAALRASGPASRTWRGALRLWASARCRSWTTTSSWDGWRAELGIGAAWYEREHRGLGVPFPPTAERFERLEEAIQICLQMWSDDNGPYRGRHYELEATLCSPAPVSTPRPRILIGGSGERK